MARPPEQLAGRPFAPPKALRASGFVLLSVLLVGSIWVVPYLPTNDGPEAILGVHINNHYSDAGTIYRQVFAPASQFAGHGFTLLYGPLEDLLGWRLGLQVALSLVLLIEAWGVVFFVRAIEPRRLPLALLAFPLALSWCFYMGFFPFVIASGVGLFVLALGLAPGADFRGRSVVVSALLLFQGFCHVFAAALTSVVLAVAQVAGAPRGRRMRAAVDAVRMGAPVAALAGAAYVVAGKRSVEATGITSFAFEPLATEVCRWPQTVAPGPLPRALLVALAVAAAAVVALVRCLAKETSPRDRALGLVGLAFVATGLFGPFIAPGWQFFSQRFAWMGVVLLVASTPLEIIPPLRGNAVFAALLAVASACVLWSYPFHLRLASRYADAIDGVFARVERKGVILPITLEPYGEPSVPLGRGEVPYLAPLRHIGALYAAAQGGIVPYTFAASSATWLFTIRPDATPPPPMPPHDWVGREAAAHELQTDEKFRSSTQDELATYGMYYEGVVLTGARRTDLDVWSRRGFVFDWARGSAMVGHFEPCRLDVEVPATGAVPLLDFGVEDSEVARGKLLPPTIDASGRRHLVDRGPCGDIWVRPRWDGPADGSAGPRYCANASASGKIFARADHSGATFVCAGPGAATPAP